MKLHLPSSDGVTVIENRFIDQYMPHANGEYVKVYLYLLRCASSGRELTLSAIADVLDHTEKDVCRALSYWEKQGLLALQEEEGDSFGELTFHRLPEAGKTQDSAVLSATVPDHPVETTAGSVPELSAVLPDRTISRERRRELQQSDEIRQLVFVAEQYYQRPLTSTEQSNLLYFYDKLHLSEDLIEYLIEYCISRGCTGTHYMEKVAHEWYRSGITTVAQARENTSLYNKNYYTILHELGITGRGPAPAEIEYMNRWLEEFGFTIDLILEACRRTILQIQKPQFEYVESILESWIKEDVHHLSDLTALDRKHAQRQTQKAVRSTTSTANRFRNFSQREYDWNSLEQQLLGVQERKEG